MASSRPALTRSGPEEGHRRRERVRGVVDALAVLRRRVVPKQESQASATRPRLERSYSLPTLPALDSARAIQLHHMQCASCSTRCLMFAKSLNSPKKGPWTVRAVQMRWARDTWRPRVPGAAARLALLSLVLGRRSKTRRELRLQLVLPWCTWGVCASADVVTHAGTPCAGQWTPCFMFLPHSCSKARFAKNYPPRPGPQKVV